MEVVKFIHGRFGPGRYTLVGAEWVPVIAGGADLVATKAQVLGLFKEWYGERIAEQVNREPFMMNQFKASTRKMAGKYWTVPAHLEGTISGGGPSAVGSYNEDEEGPDSGAENYVEMRIIPKVHFGTIRITGLARRASEGNLAAFAEAWASEIKQKLMWLISQLNAQFYQNGAGMVGRAGADPGAAQITVASTPAGNPDSPIPPMSWFKVGMKIDILADGAPIGAKRNAAGKKQGRIINAVNAGRIIGYEGGDIAAIVFNETGTGDVMVYEDAREGTIPAGEYGKQLSGLALLVDDTTEGPATVQNISRSTNPIWRGNRLHNSGAERELSLDLLQQLLDTNRKKSGVESDFMIMGYGMRRKYLNLLWHEVRFADQKLTGGFKTVQFDTLDILVDKDCPLGRVIALRKEKVEKFVVRELGILDDAGTQAERIPKTDVYEILLGGYFNLGIHQPNACGKMTDLVDPDVVE